MINEFDVDVTGLVAVNVARTVLDVPGLVAVTCHCAVLVPVIVPMVYVVDPDASVYPVGSMSVATAPSTVSVTVTSKTRGYVLPCVTVLVVSPPLVNVLVMVGFSLTVSVLLAVVGVAVVLPPCAETVNGDVYDPVVSPCIVNVAVFDPDEENVSVAGDPVTLSPDEGLSVTVTVPVTLLEVMVTGTENSVLTYAVVS